MERKRITLLLLSLLLSPAALAETGVALKDDQIRAEPYSDAKIAGSITRNQKVEILSRQGAWLNIQAGNSKGWVRLLSVKRGTAAAGTSTSDVLNLASGRSGTGQVVATTGVRGLSEQDLKTAKFDEAQVKALEGYTQSAAQGSKFAGAAGLKAAKLEYLPAPSTPSSSSSTASGSPVPGGAK
jgi:uncharacterized protein YgiM (DUF1202 family)